MFKKFTNILLLILLQFFFVCSSFAQNSSYKKYSKNVFGRVNVDILIPSDWEENPTSSSIVLNFYSNSDRGVSCKVIVKQSSIEQNSLMIMKEKSDFEFDEIPNPPFVMSQKVTEFKKVSSRSGNKYMLYFETINKQSISSNNIDSISKQLAEKGKDGRDFGELLKEHVKDNWYSVNNTLYIPIDDKLIAVNCMTVSKSSIEEAIKLNKKYKKDFEKIIQSITLYIDKK